MNGRPQKEFRKLDGIFVREQDDQGKYCAICLSDMTYEQREAWLQKQRDNVDGLIRCIHHLSEQLRRMGDELNIVCAE